MIRTVTAILIVGFSYNSKAMDRETLDSCEAILATTYDLCKAKKTPAECDKLTTTKLCELPWSEPYGRFIDRRIEEGAAYHPDRKPFVSLTRLKPVYAVAGGK